MLTTKRSCVVCVCRWWKMKSQQVWSRLRGYLHSGWGRKWNVFSANSSNIYWSSLSLLRAHIRWGSLREERRGVWEDELFAETCIICVTVSWSHYNISRELRATSRPESKFICCCFNSARRRGWRFTSWKERQLIESKMSSIHLQSLTLCLLAGECEIHRFSFRIPYKSPS